MAHRYRDVKGWLNRMLITSPRQIFLHLRGDKRKGREANPGPKRSSSSGQSHQVATNGAEAVSGTYRITCRSPSWQPPARTSWPRTVPDSATWETGVHAPWAQVGMAAMCASELSRVFWPATVAITNAAPATIARRGIYLGEKRTAGGDRGHSQSSHRDYPIQPGCEECWFHICAPLTPTVFTRN